MGKDAWRGGAREGPFFKAPRKGTGWPPEATGRLRGSLVLREEEDGQKSMVAEREGTFWWLIVSL